MAQEKKEKNLFYTERGMLRIRWWPVLALAVVLVHDIVVIGSVAISDVAMNSSPDLWVPSILDWIFG